MVSSLGLTSGPRSTVTTTGQVVEVVSQYPKWSNHPSNGPMSLLKQRWLSADQKNCLSTDLGPFVGWFGYFWCWRLLPLLGLCRSLCCWGLGSIPVGIFCYFPTKKEVELIEDSFFIKMNVYLYPEIWSSTYY